MISETWDYLMRRKPLLWLLLVFLALGGVIGAKLMMEHRPVVSQAQEIGEGPKPVYNNSLTFRIPGTSGKPAYELVLASDFRSARINVTDEVLGAEASVKILNPSGQIVESEQTTLEDGEIKFTNTPKNYSVALGRGYVIEINGSGVQVLSNLNHSLATAFMPSGATERYVLTSDGIRKASWSDADGKAALYDLLKKYIVGEIETYKAKLTDEVLNNKNLDVAAKTQIVLAYNNLKGVDQEPYREFINHLRRGGVPEITYSGKREFTVGENVDFTKLVSVRDGEDGEYTADQITTMSEVDFSQAGKYTLSYKASDSDRNTVTLKIPITVTEVKAEVVSPEPVEVVPEKPTVDNSNTNSAIAVTSTANAQVPVVGGDLNTESNVVETNTDSETIWNEQNDIEEIAPVSVAYPASTTTNETNEPEAKLESRGGISPSQIVLLVLGIALLFGLVRFIFDHYVR